MAMINCTECNQEISSDSTACVKCGCPVKAKKKRGIIMPLIGIILMIAGGALIYISKAEDVSFADAMAKSIAGLILIGVGFVWFLLVMIYRFIFG